jgi:hypothetical protein
MVGPDGSTFFYCGDPSDETDIRLVFRLVRESAFIRLVIRLVGLKTFSQNIEAAAANVFMKALASRGK